MATPPPFVAEYEADWSSLAASQSVSVTVNADDVLVIFAATGSSTTTLSTPTGGGLTYTLQQSIVVASYAPLYVWTATSPTSQTFTMQVVRAGVTTEPWAFNVLRFSGSSGIGATAKTNVTGGAPTLAITTLQDNSAVVVADSDWQARDGTVRTWRTTDAGALTEQTYYRDLAQYAVYGGFHADAGLVGAKTVGLSAPVNQTYSIIAVEVKGLIPAGGPLNPDGIAVPVVLGSPSLSDSALAVAPGGIAVPVVLGDPAVSWSGTAAPDGIGVPVALGSPALTLAGTAPDGVNVPVALGAPSLSWSGALSPDGISVPVSLGAPGVSDPASRITHRPNTGTTTRPTTGTVTRPYTGITSRP